MFPIERQQAILTLLSQKKSLKLTDITEHFNISLETVRRDIHTLEQQGKLEKFYGGVKLRDSGLGEATMTHRMLSRLESKEAIAKKCSELITDGDCIFLDSGSTTCLIAKYIKEKRNLTVVTNSILVINELITSGIDLIIVGGKLRHTEHSVVAYDYLFNFDQLHISKCFIGAGAIHNGRGIADFSIEEAHTRKKIIKHSHKIYVAVDHSKFDKEAPIHIADFRQITGILTDSGLSKTFYKNFSHKQLLQMC
ncbi:MAG: DeoR/GlpR family DNA-binding transcription regulator [Cellulosilyticaceae bacterium]